MEEITFFLLAKRSQIFKASFPADWLR